MDEGFLIRPLPDGGAQFVLSEPHLSSLTVDLRVQLRFGATALVISGDFTVEVDGGRHHLSPARPASLAPLLSLYPGTVRWLWTSVDGDLVGLFAGGSTLTVPSRPEVEAWSVGSVRSLRSGPV